MKQSFLTATILFAFTVFFSVPSTYAQTQDKDQQKCINGLNKAGAKVAATRGKANAKCVSNAGKGKESDAQACLTADGKDKISKATAKTAATELKACVIEPAFGRAGVGQINTFALSEEFDLAAEIFGADLNAAIIDADIDKTGAGCQAQIAKTYEKLAATKMKSFLKCKKDGLKLGSIDSAATLDDCFDAVAADPKVDKAIAKLTKTVDKKCSGVVTDDAFPGDCVGALDFPVCVDAAVECHFCLTVDAMDGLSRDCDIYDDGVANLSCAVAPATTTTTTTTTSTTTSTVPPSPDWGMGCFDTGDCGSFCGGFGCQCGAFLDSILVPGGSAMCFFDCMDLGGDVLTCRASCGGPSGAPACDMTTAGGGGFPGVVTGPGACEPTGFAAAVGGGGPSGELSRIVVDFTEPIDESTLFDSPPPPCDPGCPTSCPPTASVPLADHFRLQMGIPPAGSETEVCDREGVAVSACKKTATEYVIALDAPVCTPLAQEFSLFISCHVGNGTGDFLHFSTGDYYLGFTWPP